MERHALTEEEWKRIEHLLPPQTEGKGRRWEDHRKTINGMLWIAKTGAPWRDLPLRYGKWKTVYDRFRRWTQEGLWDRILKELQGDKQENKEINWTVFFIDGSNVRAHRHAAGASKKISRE